MKSTAVAGLGLSAAGLLGACSPNTKSSETSSATGNANDIQWAETTDVIVVGFGAAGSAACIEASDAGAQVILVEATEDGGGSTAASGGTILMGGTDLQKQFGIEDNVENYYTYLTAAAGANNSDEFVRVFADSSPDLYQWCVENGMDFASGSLVVDRQVNGDKAGIALRYSGNEQARDFVKLTPAVPRGHTVQPSSTGKEVFSALKNSVEKRGITIKYQTTASRLVVDDSGRVVGIVATNSSDEVAIKATKGVVLTCGGFSDNKTMLQAYYPCSNPLGPNITSAGTENGTGILMAMDIGAATRRISCFQIGIPMVSNDESLANSILINERGSRMIAEDEYNSFIGKAVIEAPTAKCYIIADPSWFTERATKTAGTAVATGSIEEIASQLQIDAASLRNTVDYYNESVGLEEDRQFGKSVRFLKALEGNNLAAYSYGPERCWTASCSGLWIDTSTHVCDWDGKVIPGLYAAGRNASTIYGWYVGSGSSVADALTFGRIAGKNAATAS